jgi:chromosome segregation ATPase
MANLKFYKGKESAVSAKNPAAGSVWFDTDNRLIKIKLTDGTWQSYSGLQDAKWEESSKSLVLTKANGDKLTVNLSDVASASVLAALQQTVADNKIAADNGIAEAKDAAKAVADDLAAYKTSNNKEIAALKAKDTALDGEIANLKAADVTMGADIADLKTLTQEHETEITALQGLVGTESVKDQIDDAIAKYDTDTVQPGLDAKADDAEFQAYKTANNAAVKKVSDDLAAEVIRATQEEARIEGLVTAHTGNTDIHVTADQKAAWNKAKEDIDAFLAATNDKDAVIETIKEINDYVNEHTEAFTALSGRVGVNETDIATLKGDVAELEAADQTLQGNIDTLAGRVTTVEGKVGALETKVDVEKVSTAIEAAVSPVRTDVGNLKTWRATLAGEYAAQDGKYIASVKQTDGKIEATYGTLPTIPDVEGMINTAIGKLDAEVKDESGYATATLTQVDGKVTALGVDVATGSVANGADALAVASDVKTYVDDQLAAS